MQGLIWGAVRLDGRPAQPGDLDELHRSVRDAASIAHHQVVCTGAAVMAQAALMPTGATVRRVTPQINMSPSGPVVADLRLYCGQPENFFEAVAVGRPNAVASLDGDFAAAAWDEGEGTLTLVRDHLGARPLFFTVRPGVQAAFCSLAAPLIDAGLAAPDKDPESVLRSLSWDFDLGSKTFVKALKRVPAGHLVKIRSGRVQQRRYWIPALEKRAVRGRSPVEIAEQAAALLERAVTRRMPTDDVAVQCSAGLDSSSVAVIAAEHAERAGKTVFGAHHGAAQRADIDPVDGRPLVDALAQRLPALQVRSYPRENHADLVMSQHCPDLALAHDREQTQLGRAMADIGAAGISVMMTGYGGDETYSFNGDGALAEALLSLDPFAAITCGREIADADRKPLHLIYGRELAHALVPGGLMARIRKHRNGRATGTELLREYLTPEGRRLAGRYTRKLSAKNQRRDGLMDGRLAQMCEKLATDGARHGVAVAHPFLDKKLVEFSLALPAQVFCRDGTRRWLLRQAIGDRLPESILSQGRKIANDNSIIVTLAEQKHRLIEETRRLAKTPAARWFDPRAMAAAFAALPSVKDARLDANERATKGQTPDGVPASVLIAFAMARFIAGDVR